MFFDLMFVEIKRQTKYDEPHGRYREDTPAATLGRDGLN